MSTLRTSPAPRVLLPVLLLALLLATAPAWANIYKWVDEKGVVNYSATPPAKKAEVKSPVKILDTGESRLSVYTPARLPEAPRDNASESLRNRVEQLENQLAAERTRRAHSAAEADDRKKRAYEECIRARRVDCDPTRAPSSVGTVYPYPVIPAFVGRAPSVITPTFFVNPPAAPVATSPGWGKPGTSSWK